jgi:HTH-type transcriptional regulator/antitoxin HipB
LEGKRMPTIPVTRLRDLTTVIRAVRESRQLSQDDLATSLAISPQYLQLMESGKPNLYTTRLFRILNKLGIKVSVTYELKRSAPSND